MKGKGRAVRYTSIYCWLCEMLFEGVDAVCSCGVNGVYDMYI